MNLKKIYEDKEKIIEVDQDFINYMTKEIKSMIKIPKEEQKILMDYIFQKLQEEELLDEKKKAIVSNEVLIVDKDRQIILKNTFNMFTEACDFINYFYNIMFNIMGNVGYEITDDDILFLQNNIREMYNEKNLFCRMLYFDEEVCCSNGALIFVKDEYVYILIIYLPPIIDSL